MPLVPLGAVRRNAHQVGKLTPEDVPMDSVDEVVRRPEAPGSGDVGMDESPLERVDARFPRNAGQLDVSKTVIREPRLIGLDVPALEDIDVFGVGVLVRQGVQRPVFV